MKRKFESLINEESNECDQYDEFPEVFKTNILVINNNNTIEEAPKKKEKRKDRVCDRITMLFD